jgi:hypothetical protein
MKFLRSLTMIPALLAISACGNATGPTPATFLRAEIAGSIVGEYSGTGSFQTRPAFVPGPRFTLHSSGTGASANQGFAFMAAERPAPGEHAVGDVEAGLIQAHYWYDEGHARRLFQADSGSLQITESSDRRMVGTFEISARLVYLCEIVPGFPGDLMVCDPADETASVVTTGSFYASPIGG